MNSSRRKRLGCESPLRRQGVAQRLNSTSVLAELHLRCSADFLDNGVAGERGRLVRGVLRSCISAWVERPRKPSPGLGATQRGLPVAGWPETN